MSPPPTAASSSAHARARSVEDIGKGHASVTAGGNLRAAVFGVSDGLVSNTSLILGVAGAVSDPHLVLVSGAAGLLAGALSMAAGEFVSVSSQRELYQHELAQERDEIERHPREEVDEIAVIYQSRGVPQDDACRVAKALSRDPDHALETHAREELGINPDDLGSPLGAATSSFLAFAVGALLPLLPFLFGNPGAALPLTVGLAAVALFAVGATVNRLTRQSIWRGGLRMLLIGGGAGVATYAIGRLWGGAG